MGYEVEASEVMPEKVDFKVMRSNWPAVLTFLGLETQWRSVGLHTRMFLTGLDYSAVDAFLRRRDLPDDVFDDLQIMENAALAALNEVYRRGR